MSKANSLSSLTTLLFELSRIMRQMMLTDKSGELNYFHLYTLLLIRDEEGMVMKDLASLLKISSSTATALVDRLVAQKCIKRSSDAHNRKLVCLQLTTTGHDILKKNFKQKEQFLQHGISQLSPTEVMVFEQVLRKMVGAYSPMK